MNKRAASIIILVFLSMQVIFSQDKNFYLGDDSLSIIYNEALKRTKIHKIKHMKVDEDTVL